MKSIKILIIATLLLLSGLTVQAQVNDTIATRKDVKSVLSSKDSTYLRILTTITEMSIKPRFKMYKTENIYNLLKLDTSTGAIWQVQYGMNNNSDRMEVAVDRTSLLYDWEDVVPGRFELYPTQNMYTFILLDTKHGWTYQVQWSTKADQRFRIPIY